jgi:serine/threonine-protein kinase HipA
MLKLNRRGLIQANGVFAGVISEYTDLNKEEFVFEYDHDYLKNGSPIGHHYLLTSTPYITNHLPPFFSNLVSEGWLRGHQSKKANISKDDCFGLLLANGSELIGAISVIPDKEV